MIEPGRGDLLQAGADALVNAVNTEGVMGKGLALQFKRAFPDAFRAYAAACRRGELRTGKVHVFRRAAPPFFIVHFPTKQSWREPSRIEWIRDGLTDLVAQVRTLGIRSIAVPPLGCGLGGLAWTDVEPLILDAFETLPGLRAIVYEPLPSPTRPRP